MEDHYLHRRTLTLVFVAATVLLVAAVPGAADIFLEWEVAADSQIRPVSTRQPVITINGMFPGPLINTTTNDVVHVNVLNSLDESILITWHGIQQRLDSWQDGVSGTNCPIRPGTNWTYVFQVKDQIGSFFYSLSTGFHKAAGGYGPLRVNNRNVILVPFPKPEAEFDLLVGDWYGFPFKIARDFVAYSRYGLGPPRHILINGKPPYNNSWGGAHESLEVEQGKTYRLRISNVGTALSFNFRIQNHRMVLVETEGSYTQQIELDSLDVHVGQSYSVLVTADQYASAYYMVATPTLVGREEGGYIRDVKGVAVLRYSDSTAPPAGPLPAGPDPSDRDFSVNQARSIRWNLTAGAARPNPQGTFNVSNVTLSQTFVLRGSREAVGNLPRYAVNNVSYLAPETPPKLADYFVGGAGVFQLDAFPTHSVNLEVALGTSVVSGTHKGWLEVVFVNGLGVVDAWHLDGFGFYVVGFGDGEWSPAARETYNVLDPVVRSTVQVYPGGWSAVYAYVDNPGMWNLRSQRLENWYLGQELYIRVHDPDPNPAKERPPPDNLLLCGILSANPVAPAPVSPGVPIEIAPAPSPEAEEAPAPTPGDSW